MVPHRTDPRSSSRMAELRDTGCGAGQRAGEAQPYRYSITSLPPPSSTALPGKAPSQAKSEQHRYLTQKQRFSTPRVKTK